MASKLISHRVKQTGYLAGYFVLMLYTLSGLMFQGSMWLLAGAICWFGIVSRFTIVSYINRCYTKRLEEISLKTERSKREEGEKGQKRAFEFEFL